MAKRQKAVTRHRLLIYERIGRRWRGLPLLLIVLSLGLYALGWLGHSGQLGFGDVTLLGLLWQGRSLIILLLLLGLMLYIFVVLLSVNSFVEARPQSLRVRAGLLTLDFSYARLSMIRLVQFSAQYPPQLLRPGERALVSPLLSATGTAVDMRSWPVQPRLLRRIWSRFMFASEGDSLMFIVRDAMLLNRQIDNYIEQYRIRQANQEHRYKDPIERAVEQNRRNTLR
ncbi:MAG: hypothetical protein IT326_06360 [Anaerolineae bacterium]|nr:hypothetical protein [Anaerolineae bacterium]